MTEIVPYILMIDSSDVVDLENWDPKTPDEIFFQLTLRIRIGSNVGADNFQMLVATEEGVARFENLYSKELTNSEQRILLFVDKYDWSSIRERIEKIVDECRAASEEECNALLRLRFDWEYEGMTTKAEGLF